MSYSFSFSFRSADHQNSFSSCEQEELLKVSRNISSSVDMYGSVGSHYSKRHMRQSNLWNSYSNESAGSMLESPSSSVDSLDPSSPRQRPSATDSSGGGSFYVTMVPLKSGSKVSVSEQINYNPVRADSIQNGFLFFAK